MYSSLFLLVYFNWTAFNFIVMPRSLSKSIPSNTCSFISLFERVFVFSRIRSARVDLPWSICAIIEKFRTFLFLFPIYVLHSYPSLIAIITLTHKIYYNNRVIDIQRLTKKRKAAASPSLEKQCCNSVQYVDDQFIKPLYSCFESRSRFFRKCRFRWKQLLYILLLKRILLNSILAFFNNY